jgi:hypothetical protein
VPEYPARKAILNLESRKNFLEIPGIFQKKPAGKNPDFFPRSKETGKILGNSKKKFCVFKKISAL